MVELCKLQPSFLIVNTMKIFIHFVLLSLIGFSHAAPLNGRLEAEWQAQLHMENKGRAQSWINQDKRTAIYSAGLQLNKGALSSELIIDQDALSLKSLYLDIELQQSDWTLGRKPQQWSFAMMGSRLNWLDQQWLIMREQYFSTGSWQLTCAVKTDNRMCASRISGWHDLTDWQLLASFGKTWQFGGALQQTVGESSLIFAEYYYHSAEQSAQLNKLTDNIYRSSNKSKPFSQLNFGAQWSSRWQTTLHTEVLINNAGLNKYQWHKVQQQLNTPTAGLVAPSFEGSFNRLQTLFRLSQTWQNITLENNFIYWPLAQNTWLNEMTISRPLNDNFEVALSFNNTNDDGLLSAIGKQNSIALSFGFKEGF